MPTSRPSCPVIVARSDATMDVRVVRHLPLRYASGPDPVTDRPAHVRAGSGLTWVGPRLAIVQDDANFIALVDVETGLADFIELPAGHSGLRQFDDGRGNKKYKNDFESLVSVPHRGGTRLLAIGSGSTAEREKVAMVHTRACDLPAVRVVDARAFYDALRRCEEFSGSELNIEGAALVGEELRLFNRGNGALRDNVRAVNATCDVDLVELLAYLENAETNAPTPRNVVQYDLGAIGETQLSFTDAMSLDASESWGQAIRESLGIASNWPAILYAAAAEASPDAVMDGEISGSAIGFHTRDTGSDVIRWAPVRTQTGDVAKVKVEGVAAGTRPSHLFVVVDSDQHEQPSELYELNVQIISAER